MDTWRTLPQDIRDAAYDVNAAVRNSAELIEKRNSASFEFRKQHTEALDIPYASHSERCAFDLYPAANSNAPCLIFIHGGWWQRNGRDNFSCYARGLVEAGWSVAMPGYTLAPNASLTEIVREIGLALDWLANNGSKYGVSGHTIICGWSAGAHLASLYLSHPAILGGLLIAGAYDLSRFQYTKFNDAVRLNESEISLFTPLRQTPPEKQVAIAVGTAEVPILVKDSIDLHRHRQLAGVTSEFIPVREANHFTILDEMVSPRGLLVEAAVSLTERRNKWLIKADLSSCGQVRGSNASFSGGAAEKDNDQVEPG